MNVYQAVRGYIDSGLDITWVQKNQDLWQIYCAVNEIRRDVEKRKQVETATFEASK